MCSAGNRARRRPACAAAPDLLLPLPELPADLESQLLAASPAQDDPLAALIEELRNYQAELALQNQVLNYSQAVAESASERF